MEYAIFNEQLDRITELETKLKYCISIGIDVDNLLDEFNHKIQGVLKMNNNNINNPSHSNHKKKTESKGTQNLKPKKSGHGFGGGGFGGFGGGGHMFGSFGGGGHVGVFGGGVGSGGTHIGGGGGNSFGNHTNNGGGGGNRISNSNNHVSNSNQRGRPNERGNGINNGSRNNPGNNGRSSMRNINFRNGNGFAQNNYSFFYPLYFGYLGFFGLGMFGMAFSMEYFLIYYSDLAAIGMLNTRQQQMIQQKVQYIDENQDQSRSSRTTTQQSPSLQPPLESTADTFLKITVFELQILRDNGPSIIKEIQFYHFKEKIDPLMLELERNKIYDAKLTCTIKKGSNPPIINDIFLQYLGVFFEDHNKENIKKNGNEIQFNFKLFYSKPGIEFLEIDINNESRIYSAILFDPDNAYKYDKSYL